MSRLPRGVWAAAGVLAVAAAVGVPSERAVAAGARLEVTSSAGGYTVGSYTLEAMPYTDRDPNTGNSVKLANTGATKITSYTLTVDYSSLGGAVDVTAPFSGCEKKTEGVLVCQGKDAPAPGRTTRLDNFRVRSLKGVRGGTTGEIRVSGQADGAAITERVWKVHVVDVGFAQDRFTGELKGEVKPGAEVRPGAGFTYFGANTLKGTDLSMHAGHGSFKQEFGNCTYGKLPIPMDSDPGILTDLAFPAAVCHFDNTIEVGDSFDVSPGPLRVDDDALGTALISHLGDTDQLRKMTDVHPGKGPELKLVPRPDDAPPGNPQDNRGGVGYKVDTTADAEAVGASAEGRPGDVVTVQVGYRNNGPGGMPTWTGTEPLEDPSVATTITIPPGTTVVKVPKRCWAEDDHETRTGGRVYTCRGENNEWWVGSGERLIWPFKLRIDKAPVKPGKVSLKVLRESDSNTRNDTTAITVKAPHATGAGAAPWIAGTAGVLAAGAGTVLFVTARRRRRT
ncbi:hypothetical protein [Streptomyces triticiradicis]|uniref:Uncharacterized protein n=1 Tax=Streptomyces triticiradicis TaxID=2651189 RepID=A0A7J5DBY5_9ACTN|nr:hypothetical protein [Streptomyces triticiradicis]KAB1986333.1 hypothetical protein F8144_23380 [Streptomyces triticiradicis]